MRLLLDTHVLIWNLEASNKIRPDLRDAIEHGRNAILVSDAALWEIAIKRARGRLGAPDDLPELLVGLGFTLLPITTAAAWSAGGLPAIHKDPFDRMMIQQALSEDLVLATHDKDVWRYGPACGLKVWRT